MREKEFRPYVGVTGYMNLTDVEDTLTVLPQNPPRDLMVGVLMSSKTLRGEPNKWPGRYPKKEAVAGIFPNHPNTLNLIHYNTDTPERLVRELYDLTEIGGENLDGFQLNVAWPSAAHIEAYRDAHLGAVIVLQIGSKAMAEEDNDPYKVAERVHDYYRELVSAVLIDPSGGKGEMLDIEMAREYLDELRQQDGHSYGVGVAGGLCAASVPRLNPLFKQYHNLSTDAEGQLRTPQPEDKLKCYEAMDYVSMMLMEVVAHCEAAG